MRVWRTGLKQEQLGKMPRAALSGKNSFPGWRRISIRDVYKRQARRYTLGRFSFSLLGAIHTAKVKGSIIRCV